MTQRNYTNQSAFNKAANHLLKQNKKCVEPGTDECLYRGPEGSRCAVGALITDKEIKEHHIVEGMDAMYVAGSVPSLEKVNGYLLEDVQNCHDTSRPSRWPARLRAIAKQYSLNIPASLRIKK